MDESKIIAELRVKSCVVSEFPKRSKKPFSNEKTDEVWEIKAEGVWKPEIPYPMSLHFTTYPGNPAVPPFGNIKITIETLDPTKKD
jgi:hypothetical protein